MNKQFGMGLEIDIFDRRGRHVDRYVEPVRLFMPPQPMVEIYDVLPDGRLGELRLRKPMDSYVGNFMRILSIQATNSAFVAITDTGGTSRTPGASFSNFLMVAALADATYGVVVGTGTNPVALADNKLQTQIAEGSGSGQLNHQAVQFETYTTTGQTISFVVKRRFVNNTASTITIQEKALYVKMADNNKYCIARELVGVSGYDVLAGATCEVRFTIPQTASTGFCPNGFIRELYLAISNNTVTPTSPGLKDATGGFNVNGITASPFILTANLGDATSGIIAGTGATAVDVGDYKIQTLIAHGVGSGQLQYQNMLFDNVTIVGSTLSFGVKRTFVNGSGASITINETGAYYVMNYGGNKSLLYFRNVLLTPQVIVNAGSAQVKYVPFITV